MTPHPPGHPDVRRQLKDRLLQLSPRAFELFAGDLLSYIGLQNVAVTRYSGDSGIDAHGDLIASSSLARVPTGVQVKRHRANVGRPDIDRFIGALGGRFNHGIFITTADFAPQARAKASALGLVRIDTVSGDQVAALMAQQGLGLQSAGEPDALDELYFLGFEAQAHSGSLRERGAVYELAPEDDLVSLRTLSYMLHVDMQTIRRGWIETGRLLPDAALPIGPREAYFFRRSRADQIRRQFGLQPTPTSGTAWRQEFLDYARSRSLTRSYKPVLLKALLKLADRNGEVHIDTLADEFLAFYIQRQALGQPVEFGGALLADPASASREAVVRLIIKNPLERFIIRGFLEYSASDRVVRVVPQLWSELRMYDVLDLLERADEQLRYYYGR
jgi:hypothetical protein